MRDIDQIILSCNEDPTYMEFWKPVSWAYKKIFPDVKVHLAFLTNRSEDDELVKEFRQYGDVTLFPVLPDIPEFGQAKMIRFLLASMQGMDVCYIDDIDLFPLRKDFITDKVSQRPQGTLLCVGGEVYGHNGCYPVSQMTAEGYVWKKILNPHSKSVEEVLRSYKDHAVYDRRENISIVTNFAIDNYFSDERLLRRLVHENPVPKLELARGYEDYLAATIDRHTFGNDYWNYDRKKLKSGGYFNAHGVRPYERYKEHYEPLIQFINDNY